MNAGFPSLATCHESGVELPALVWRFAQPLRCVSTAAVGGGITRCAWIVNAQVESSYRRTDLQAHAEQLAASLSLDGHGPVMLTGVDVRRRQTADVDGAVVTATVGVADPVWAADSESRSAAVVGTINVVVFVPVAIAVAGMVNLVATLTEAKCQALQHANVPGTGTPTDAVTVVCPENDNLEPFGGPRSTWGARVANAAFEAIAAGL